MQLHRLLAHVAHGLAALVLGAGHGCATLGRWRIEFEGRVVAHGTGQLQLHLHVRRTVAQRLKAADDHAKLFARVEVLGRDGHGFVHNPDSFRTQGGNAHIYCVVQRGLAVQRDQGGGCALANHFSGAAAVLRAIASGADTCGRALHQKQRYAAVDGGGHQKSIGMVAYSHDAFAGLHGPAGCSLRGRGLADFCAVAGSALLVRQHHQGFATGNARQPVGLHGLGGVATDDRTRYQTLRQRLQHDAAAQLFHGHHAFDRPHAQTALVFGNVETAQAQLGHFIEALTREATGLGGRAAAVKAVALVYPFAYCIAQLFLVVRKIEIHGVLLFSPERFGPRYCAALRCCRRKSWFCVG